MQFRFKSIATQIIMSVMPILILSSLLYVFVCYYVSHRNINTSIDEKMVESLNVANQSMQNELNANAAIAKSFASFATASNQSMLSAATFENYLSAAVGTNQNTVGGGIWYEPYRYRTDLFYFGPYVYKDGDQIFFTADYENTVNYHEMDWYTSGIPSQGRIIWSDAYHDPVPDVSMVTSTQAIYDSNGTFVGVATADMALDVIRQIVSQIRIGETGNAFLLGRTGEYIYFSGVDKGVAEHMHEDANPALAQLGAHLLSSASGTTTLAYNGENLRIYYMTIPDVEWKLGITIQEREIGRSTRSQMILYAAVPLIGLLLSAFALVRVARQLQQVTKTVNAVAIRAAGGDFDAQIDVMGQDEFSVMEHHLNIMITNMRKMSRQSAERLQLAQEANQAKSDFLSRMSHEIRTPINAIIGMTQIARNANETAKFQECLGKIDIASKQLLSLVNDILDMSKIEANKLTLEEKDFSFDALIHNVTTIASVKAAEKEQSLDITVAPDFPAIVVGDELRISQVLNNLLSNAVKFTPKRGRIELKFDAVSQEDKQFILRATVSDSGIGISEEQIDKLFASFEQADGSISRRFGGTGLGLAICRRIVDIMGGELTVRSALGKGSEFTALLPLGISQQEFVDITEVSQEIPDLSRFRILLVEDIDINREIVYALLEDTQVQIDAAVNGVEACEIVATNAEAYHLILMDLQMPEMGGLEATERIRSMDIPHCQTIPIVAMTANAFQEDIDQCMAVGMNRHIAKPIDSDLLVRTLAEMLTE